MKKLRDIIGVGMLATGLFLGYGSNSSAQSGTYPYHYHYHKLDGLMEKLRGTGWREVSETVSVGGKPDDSYGDYLIIEKGLAFRFKDGGSKYALEKVSKIEHYKLYENNKNRVHFIAGGIGWYTLDVNDDMTKMSLTISGKMINYERYHPRPKEKSRLIEEIKGKWNEVKEIVLEDKEPDGSKGDYFNIYENLEFKIKDGEKLSSGKIENYTLYETDNNIIKIYDGRREYKIELNKNRSKMSLFVPWKTMIYERDIGELLPGKLVEPANQGLLPGEKVNPEF